MTERHQLVSQFTINAVNITKTFFYLSLLSSQFKKFTQAPLLLGGQPCEESFVFPSSFCAKKYIYRRTSHDFTIHRDKLSDVNVLNVLTLRKFSMSEALPVIFFLHFGHRGLVRPNLNCVEIILLNSHLQDIGDSLAGLTNVVAVDTVEDLGGRRHLIKTNLQQ